PMPKIGFQDEEEYLAITCQNVYISARCKCVTELRGGNHMAPEVYQSRLNPSFLVPAPPLSVSFLADRDYREVMKRLVFWRPIWGGYRTGEDLAALSLIPDSDAPYNPFHEYRFNMTRYLNLKPDVDYIEQYNHMVQELKALVTALPGALMMPAERA